MKQLYVIFFAFLSITAKAAAPIFPADYQTLVEEPNYQIHHKIGMIVDYAQQRLIDGSQQQESLNFLYFAAIELKNADAMMMLANLYATGNVVEKDKKIASYYMKMALDHGWHTHRFQQLISHDEQVNQLSRDWDNVIEMMPGVIYNKAKSVATHGTSAILVGDPELKEEEDLFARLLGRALSGLGKYVADGMKQASK